MSFDSIAKWTSFIADIVTIIGVTSALSFLTRTPVWDEYWKKTWIELPCGDTFLVSWRETNGERVKNQFKRLFFGFLLFSEELEQRRINIKKAQDQQNARDEKLEREK